MDAVELGCDYVRLEGWVYKADGSPADGVTVQLQWGAGTEYWKIGAIMEESGFWKFTPMQPYQPSLHASTTFIITIVRSESDPTPLSEPLPIEYQDCAFGPELFQNIIFDEL